MKKYTLYYKSDKDFGKNIEMPILTCNLREMDKFTTCFKNYFDLYNSFPLKLKNIIINNSKDVSNVGLKDNLYIQDEDKKYKIEFLFSGDEDVLYITPSEINKILLNIKMNLKEFQSTLLKTCTNKENKEKYKFYKYLYNTYVKNKEVIKMIDLYDIEESNNNLSVDNKYIAALATDKTNILVLSKKLEQDDYYKRDLTLNIKKLYKSLDKNKLISDNVIKERKNIDLDDVINQIEKNLFNKRIKRSSIYI